MKEILFKKNEAEFLLKLISFNKKMKTPMIKTIERKLKNSLKDKIQTSSAKAKGRNLQYWVCERIANIFNVKFKQKNDDSLIQSRPMGQSGEDIILRGELRKQFPYSIECKCCENLSLASWIRQAKSNASEDRNWLLVVKKKTIGETIVIMTWETFEKTYKGINR